MKIKKIREKQLQVASQKGEAKSGQATPSLKKTIQIDDAEFKT